MTRFHNAGEFKSTADYQYQLLRCNVDLLKIIQLGLTFLDENGKLPENGPSTWQFNFKFNLTEDMYAEDSVDLLQNSGIQFEKHEQEGIDPIHFAEMMLISGLVLMENVKWLSFHSGYDFGYLLNLLTNQNLPKTEGEFFELLKLYFPNVYDVKYLMKSCKNLKGGLQEVANELEVPRIGPQHQAGSDSLLTGQTFFKMKEMFFENDIDDSKYCGHLYGLGTSYVVGKENKNNSSTAGAAAAASSSSSADDTTTTTKTSSGKPISPCNLTSSLYHYHFHEQVQQEGEMEDRVRIVRMQILKLRTTTTARRPDRRRAKPPPTRRLGLPPTPKARSGSHGVHYPTMQNVSNLTQDRETILLKTKNLFLLWENENQLSISQQKCTATDRMNQETENQIEND